MPEIRRQATLFLQQKPEIEAIRSKFNPRQAELIAAHVTLCREDEVKDWDKLADRLEGLPSRVTLQFTCPVREGNLVIMPAIDSDGSFIALREHLLSPDPVRDHSPHLTLIHPRNGTCTDNIWDTIRYSIKPFDYTFNQVSLIFQQNGEIWQTLRTFLLK